VGATPVLAVWTTRAQGDQRRLGLDESSAAPPEPVPSDRVVHRLTQVHGGRVLAVGPVPLGVGLDSWAPDPGGRPPPGDALVSSGTDDCLAVLSADCATVALASPEGVHAAVHAGWRGLLAGVVQAATVAMGDLGAHAVQAAVGPCIHPCCYAFGQAELDVVAARYGDAVRGLTAAGEPALDLPAALRAALGEAGVDGLTVHGGCTVCGPDAFSFRRTRTAARQALLVWRAAA
jgi:YfiH family protein